MSEVGLILRRDATTQGGYRGRSGADVRLTTRHRKFIVAATLLVGDLAAACAAVALDRVLAEAIGVRAAQGQYLSIVLLAAAFIWFELYSGCGPSPYERFRLR